MKHQSKSGINFNTVKTMNFIQIIDVAGMLRTKMTTQETYTGLRSVLFGHQAKNHPDLHDFCKFITLTSFEKMHIFVMPQFLNRDIYC